MMKLRLLLLRLIHHPALFAGLRQHRLILLLPVLCLLILLCQIARLAATRAQAIRARIALELVLGAHVAARKHRQHEGYA